jgi:hypothetical protein
MARADGVLGALALLGGCFFLDLAEPIAATAAGDWYEVGPILKPPEEVLRAAREIVTRQGYAILEPPRAPYAFETDWVVQLSAHWREGYRTRLEVHVAPVEPRGVVARVRSFREFNDNAREPMSLEKASWTGASIDPRHAEKISEPALRVAHLLQFKYFGVNPDE